MKLEKKYLKNNNNYDILLYHHQGDKDKPLVLFFHGLFIDSTYEPMLKIAEEISKLGNSVALFDYTAHGKSQGKFSDFSITQILKDKETILTYLKKQGYNKYIYLGGSLGGYPSLLDNYDEELKGIILIFPGLNLVPLILKNQASKHFKGNVKKRHNQVKTKEKISFFMDVLKYNVYKQAKKCDKPIILFHGHKDKVVPISQSQQLQTKGDMQIHFIKNMGHDLEKHHALDEIIIPNIVSWLKDF